MAYKDPDKQREAIALCRHCGHRLELVPGKVQKQFCNDACRKAYKRAKLKESEAIAGPSVAEPRTNGTNQPRTATPDKGMTVTNDRSCDKPPDVIFERTAQGNIRVSKPGDADKALPDKLVGAMLSGDVALADKYADEILGPMTVMECLFYRPVNQLGRGETNFVSLPGRACYGVI